MPLDAVNFHPLGPVKSVDLMQFYNLLTGVMTDQPVTQRNALSIGGNQGQTTVPLKVYGATGQNTNLVDLYTDRAAAQPGFGLSAAGTLAWGPGGTAPQDTYMSRIAMQNGHPSDTPGLLVSPLMEIDGALTVNGLTTIKGGLTTGGGALTVGDTQINGTLGVTGAATFNGGITSASTLQVNAPMNVTGAATMGSTLNVTGAVVGGGIVQAGGAINAYGGIVNFEGSNAVNIQWRGDLAALYFPYGNGIYAHAATVAGTITLAGGASLNHMGHTFAGGASVLRNASVVDRVRIVNHLDVDYDSVIGRNFQVNGASTFAGGQNITWASSGVGGKPGWVLGQAGDGLFHWYAASSIGPPALVSFALTQGTPGQGSTGSNGNQNWTTMTIAGAGNAYLRNDGTQLTVLRPGYYVVSAGYAGYYQIGGRILMDGGVRMTDTESNPDFGASRVVFGGIAGSSIQVQRYASVQTTSKDLSVWFVPTLDYPG